VRKKPKDLLRDLANSAQWSVCLNMDRKGKPGEWITRLPDEKREVLSQLKSEDIKDDRYGK
jgi:hypothetical protein